MAHLSVLMQYYTNQTLKQLLFWLRLFLLLLGFLILFILPLNSKDWTYKWKSSPAVSIKKENPEENVCLSIFL